MSIKYAFKCSFGMRVAAFATVAMGLGWQTARAGVVEAWGYQVGYAPKVVAGLSNGVSAIAAGAAGDHNLVIENGTVYAWGANYVGQLGNGTTNYSSTPVVTTGPLSGATAIACGDSQSLAVVNGGLYAWGDNIYGDVGDGTTVQRDAPVPVSGLSSGVTAVAAGLDYSLAVQSGGVYAWGANFHGQLGNGTTSGFSPNPAPVAVTGLSTGVTAIAAGGSYEGSSGDVPDGTYYADCLALKSGGVYAWGYNAYGQFGNGTTTNSLTPVAVTGLSSGVTAIAAGSGFNLAVRNGNVYAWGSNSYGQLGDETNNTELTPEQIDPTALADIATVAASDLTSYALSTDGSIWDWGYNEDGELGLGSTATNYEYLTPQHLLPPSGYMFTSISSQADGDSVLATIAPIPEPTSLWLLAIGSAGLLGRRRMKASTI